MCLQFGQNDSRTLKKKMTCLLRAPASSAWLNSDWFIVLFTAWQKKHYCVIYRGVFYPNWLPVEVIKLINFGTPFETGLTSRDLQIEKIMSILYNIRY